MAKTCRVKSEVWLYPGMVGWHFLSVDTKKAALIRKKHGSGSRGFGSLPVTVTLGKTTWQTSIFPDKKSGTYLLPLKAVVRKKEDILAGDTISFFLEIR